MSIILRLNNITALPTLPEVAIKVQGLIFSDEGCSARLSKIIEQDPALTTAILRVANSSFYGATGRVSSIPTAITRLGLNEIGHIVIASSVIRKLSRKSNLLDYRMFWKHALTAAHLATFTGRISVAGFSTEDRQALYLSGLLHDIGILIYDQFFHDEFEHILNYAVENEVSYIEAERAVAPKDTHAALGAALLEIWKLSPAVINGVRFHHDPDKAPAKQKTIPFATHLSECILCNSGIGSFEGLMNRHDSCLGELGIGEERLPEYLSEAEAEVERSDLISAIGGAVPVVDQNRELLLRTV